MSASVGLNVFFPPTSLNIKVDRPDVTGVYDRTIEYIDRKHQLSFGGREPSRGEDIQLVTEGETVRLVCQAGDSNPLPVFRWTSAGGTLGGGGGGGSAEATDEEDDTEKRIEANMTNIAPSRAPTATTKKLLLPVDRTMASVHQVRPLSHLII